MTKPFVALGWAPGARSGWGQFGLHFARTCSNAGYRVTIPGLDPSGIMPTDLPLLQSLERSLPTDGEGWLFMPIGNAMEQRPEFPSHIRVAGIIFCEDVGVIDAARLNAYDAIVAGSRWTERVLREKGVERVVLCHQGYDGRVFFPAPNDGKQSLSRALERLGRGPMIFSAGKLEFRKGQDIVVEAFRRFRETSEGKDAVLVTNWQNMWPATMDGIWLSGYVKGVPKIVNGQADIVGWLELNGLPRESVIDCGWLSQPEVAHVMRSCTVGVFPNRAESGTNLPLVEACATGLRVITSLGHGHDDVTPNAVRCHNLSVPQGCPLYRSTDGWVEMDPDHVVHWLRHEKREPATGSMDGYWDWSIRGPAIVEAVRSAVLHQPV